ncbi:MAG: translocation/assembly module TamB [Bacteroidia bacterium]|nr:translocation/assembly module TamB [Bacteroidia bacterium]
MTHKIASYYSQKLHTEVRVGEVDIAFFKKLVLRDVYVQDLHKDTLLFFNELKLDISDLDFDKHDLMVSEIELVNPKVKLIRYAGEPDFNFQFLVSAFTNADTLKADTASATWNLKCTGIKLSNVFFIYRDQNDTSATTGMNYWDLQCKNVNGNIRDIHFNKDTVYFNIEKLTAHEKCGFILSSLDANSSLSPKAIVMNNLMIKTPGSRIKGSYSMSYNTFSDFIDYNNKVIMKADLDSTWVVMNDIAYFAPPLKGINQTLFVSGQVNGTVSSLKCKKMKIGMGSATHFDGNIELTGLPNVDEFIMNIDAKKITTIKADIELLPTYPFEKGEALKVPSNISTLGTISFRGNFTGYLNDFVAYGVFNTALGSFSSDLSMKEGIDTKRMFYKGKLKSSGFDIGKFLEVKQVGVLALDADIDGSGLQTDKVDAHVKGNISRFDAMNYSYKNINVEARLAKKVFDGSLALNDDNAKLKFSGTVDFSKKLPLLNFNADLKQADLKTLHIIEADSSTVVSSTLDFKMQGNSIDNVTGFANLNNTYVKVGTQQYNFKNFNLSAIDEGQNKHLKINSDFIDCDVQGKYTLKDLGTSFENSLSYILPAYFSSKHLKTPSNQQFDVKAKLGHSDDFTKLFFPKIEIANGTTLSGKFNSPTDQFSITLESPHIKLYGNKLDNVTFSSIVENKKMNLNFSSSVLGITDSLLLKNFDITSITQNDSASLNVKWDNKSLPAYKADIKAKAIFTSTPEIRFNFLPSEIIITDSVWAINSANQIIIDTSCFYVHNMEFSNHHQLIKVSGNSSRFSNDSMVISLTTFNLANLNKFTEAAGLKLKGIVDGKTTVSGIYSTPMIISNTSFKDFKINNESFGNGYVKTIWDSDKDALALDGLFSKDILPNILFSGYYYPKKNNDINMTLTLNSLSLDLLKPYVKDYCKDFLGQFSGTIAVKGPIAKPELTGILHVDAQKINVDYLGTWYSFKHDIIIQPNSFGVENMTVYDQIYEQNKKNNSISEKDRILGAGTANITGKVYHDNFKNFQLDFDITPQKLMVLNTNEEQNNLYYGQAYVTGPYINISGYVNNLILIEASVKTDKVNIAKKSGKTKLYIPLSGTAEVSQNNFITFVSHDTTNSKKNKYKVDLSGIQLNFDLDVTPDAEVQMIFDQKVGDVIKAMGSGTVNMEINTLGKFNMYGNYTVESGDYLFTLQNVINKRFDVEQGGTIKWSGDPYDADINLSAAYKLRTSLSPLFPGDSTGTYKRRYPVDCKMILSNKLMSPDIAFDIDLPTVNEGTRRDVRNMVNNDLEMNRQVFSLMVLGSFVTPQSLAGNGETGNAGKAASSELLSNQLSNMLSKISKDFDLGVKYRAGDKVSNEELQLALSTQLFNNRMSIDGNFGVSSRVAQTTNTLVGDVNIEYKLTDDGKMRVKAFNRTNDNAIVNLSSPYTQGIGVFYREEFNTVGELYKYYLSKMRGKKKN